MYLILVIGGTGQGKTPFIQNYCLGSGMLINDIQNEYGDRTKYKGQKPYLLSTNNSLPRSRVIKMNTKEFIKLCATKTNTICVFEEATMFFQGMISDDMRELIFSKAHSGNIYMLVFHSINSVPPRLMEASNYVVLFKTADEEKTVERKYSRLLPYFKALQKQKDGYHFKIKIV
jgi:hypothetical protein